MNAPGASPIRPASSVRRGLTFALVAVLGLAQGCVSSRMHAEQRQFAEDYYANQIDFYALMDQTFYNLGREYFMLYNAYTKAGDKEQAALAEERAREFHSRHQQVAQLLEDYRQRLRRLEADPALTFVGPSVRATDGLPAGPAAPAATPLPAMTPMPTPRPAMTPRPTPLPVMTPRPVATPTPLPTPRPTATPWPQGAAGAGPGPPAAAAGAGADQRANAATDGQPDPDAAAHPAADAPTHAAADAATGAAVCAALKRTLRPGQPSERPSPPMRFHRPAARGPARNRGPLPESAYAGEFAAERRVMIERQIFGRGVADRRVLAAMARVPRHRFVGAGQLGEAYADHPLAIGSGQTISQPYIVARTLELACIEPGTRVLEIGVGCGYQTAILAEMGAEVFGIEIVAELARAAAERLERLGWRRPHVRLGDGHGGWPEAAPFDVIVLAAAPEAFPQPLLDQLADGGRLVGPVGPAGDQNLMRLTRHGGRIEEETICPVRFVPMTGQAQR